jgi:hypothetical protein
MALDRPSWSVEGLFYWFFSDPLAGIHRKYLKERVLRHRLWAAMVCDDRMFSVADSYPVVTLNPSGWVSPIIGRMRSRRKKPRVGEGREADPCAIVAARYLPRRDAVELAFASGGTMTIPRRAIREFDAMPIDALKGLVVSPAGDAVVHRSLEGEIAVVGLVTAVLGSRRLSAAFARRGGQRTSKAKASAARANGTKGGRPRNRSTRI